MNQIHVYAIDEVDGNKIQIRCIQFESGQDALNAYGSLPDTPFRDCLGDSAMKYMMVEIHTSDYSTSRKVSRFDSLFMDIFGISQEEVTEALSKYKMLPLLDVA